MNKQHSGALFLLLIGLALAACSSAATSPTAVNPALATAAQTTVPTNAAEWGAASFYRDTCASCHGQNGEGSPIAPPLTSETVQTADREWVMETISNGRSGTAMIAWSKEFGGPLYSDQIAQMADFVQSEGWNNAAIASGGAANIPAAAPAAVPPEAISLFAANCASCHGATGQGSPIAPPLNSAELRARLDDAALAATIGNGRPGTQMPAWGRTLTPDQIDSLVTLIRNWDSLDDAQQAQLAEQANSYGMGGGMMGRGMGGGMMGRGGRRGGMGGWR